MKEDNKFSRKWVNRVAGDFQTNTRTAKFNANTKTDKNNN